MEILKDGHWTKTRPTPPLTKPNKFYAYYDEVNKELFPVEMWPGRYIKHYEGWWWDIALDMPDISQFKTKKEE